MNTLIRLFDHAAWADDRTRAAIEGLDPFSPERAEAVRLYAHVAGADHTWLSRLQGRAPVHAIWPALSLEEAVALARESIAELRNIASGDPESIEREVIYRNSTGKEFRSTVSDILTQVVMHGSYHRGQIARLTREGGGTPAVTDYIAFVR